MITQVINASPSDFLTIDDELLWSELKSGNKKALSKIYVLYFHKLYNYGSRITKHAEIVEDSIQEMFIDIWKSKENLGDVYSIKNYLFKSLRRRILLQLNKKQKNNEVDISDELISFNIELTHKSHFLDYQINQDKKEILTRMINAFSTRQKEAIFLIFYDELSYKEAASVMSIKVRTLYNMVHSAIGKLRENLSKLSVFTLPLLLIF